jgi:hypothetical protein
MSAWLLPIFGIVIIGVIVELISRDTPIGRFVRAVYSFFILFVIVQPIPKLLNEKISIFDNGGIAVDAKLLDDINSQTEAARQTRAGRLLDSLGYTGCLVLADGDRFFINSNGGLSAGDIVKIKQIMAVEFSVSQDNIFVL